MRKIDINARVGSAAGRVAARADTSEADRGQGVLAEGFAAPQKRGTGRSAKPQNPMPWCKHSATSGFGRLCSEQLKAYKPRATGG
jgi:hypothetical protein